MTTAEPGPAPATPATAPAPNVPLIPYADLPARWGVSIERSPTSVRVVVPPVPGWRHLHKGYVVAFAVLCTIHLLEVASEWLPGEWGRLV